MNLNKLSENSEQLQPVLFKYNGGEELFQTSKKCAKNGAISKPLIPPPMEEKEKVTGGIKTR